MRRRLLSGKSWGRTWSTALRSSGRESTCSAASEGCSPRPCSGLRSLMLPSGYGPALADALRRLLQRLGQRARVGDGGHEVAVADPAGKHVHVEVLADAPSGRSAEVDADVDPARPIDP